MGLNDRKISGQPLKIAAQDWNATIDAARAERARRRDQRVESRPTARAIVTAKVRNNSAALPRFAAVALRAPIILPTDNLAEFQREPMFEAYVATASDLAETPMKPAILLQPLAADAIGDACLCGVVPAPVNILSVGDRFANLTEGQTYLTSGGSGAVEILWSEAGTGVKWALVRLPAFPALAVNGTSGANYLIGVDSGGNDLEYKQLIAGAGIAISHAAASISWSTTLVAQEFNGDTSTVNAVHTLRFDYAQGFQVSGTAGVASVTIDAASVTRTGVVTTGTQEFGGSKSFFTNATVNSAKVNEANGGYFQVWSDNGLSPLLKAADGVVTVNALTGDGAYPGLHAHYQRCWRADFVLLGQDLATYATFLSIGWESASPKILYLRASDSDAVDFSITGKYRALHSSLGPQVGVEDTINGMTFTGGILTDSASALQEITTLTGSLQAPTSIKDGNGNELIEFPTAQSPIGSAVNQVAFENAATGSPPSIKAAGNDTNTDLLISGKGTGGVDFNGSPLKNFSVDLND